MDIKKIQWQILNKDHHKFTLRGQVKQFSIYMVADAVIQLIKKAIKLTSSQNIVLA